MDEALNTAADEVRAKLNLAREIAGEALDRPSDDHVMAVFRSLLEAEARHRYDLADEPDDDSDEPRATVH